MSWRSGWTGYALTTYPTLRPANGPGRAARLATLSVSDLGPANPCAHPGALARPIAKAGYVRPLRARTHVSPARFEERPYLPYPMIRRVRRAAPDAAPPPSSQRRVVHRIAAFLERPLGAPAPDARP
jgi:hypothetical protein